MAAAPTAAQSAVLMRSEPLPGDTREVCGTDFDAVDPKNLYEVLDSMAGIGFQGSSVAEAVRIIERMVRAACADRADLYSGSGGLLTTPRTMPRMTSMPVFRATTHSTRRTCAARSCSATRRT